MPLYKIKNFFKSFRNKVIIIVCLVTIVTILLLSKFLSQKDDNKPVSGSNLEAVNEDDNENPKPDLASLTKSLDTDIDSILSGFGIKKEWITTNHNSTNDKKTTTKDAEWFTKTVIIPVDLNSIEINLDLNTHLNSKGLLTSTSEDIITKDITLTVHNPDTSKNKLPLAKINVSHSDKISRETALFCVILNNIGDYSQEEIDKFVINKSEFSFVFPRNLDEIDTQTKLLQHKKDVLINLTVGAKDNYDTDFNSGLDEKSIKEKVKSFSSDFPTITNVILTKADPDVSQSQLNSITEELSKFNIKVIKDTALTKTITPAEEDSKEKISIFFNNIKQKGVLSKNIITMIKIDPDEFEKFYNKVLTLKKLGYRFYSYNEYLTNVAAQEKQIKNKEEKFKQEQEKQKKTDVKKPIEKKTTDKKTNDKKNGNKTTDKNKKQPKAYDKKKK